MAVHEDLSNFVREALSRKLSRAQIEDALAKAGWEKGQITGALSQFAESDLPIPVPKPKVYLSARDAFLYLIIFATLYITAYHLGNLLFQLINRAFPVPNDSASHINDTLRFAISALVVGFPIYLFVSGIVQRAVRADATKRASRVRKWLTYLTLFIVACVLIGDFVCLTYNFLGGEITTRFLLKVLVVGMIAGTIFGYYLKELGIEEAEGKS